MTLFRSCAGARMRARSKGLRVLFGLASLLLLLEGCRTWDDGGGWHGFHRHHDHHRDRDHHRRRPAHVSPAPIVVPKFQPPPPLPSLPPQPAYRPPPPPERHWYHRQGSGGPSRRRDSGAGREHRWRKR